MSKRFLTRFRRRISIDKSKIYHLVTDADFRTGTVFRLFEAGRERIRGRLNWLRPIPDPLNMPNTSFGLLEETEVQKDGCALLQAEITPRRRNEYPVLVCFVWAVHRSILLDG